MTRLLIYLAAALSVAIVVAVVGSRQQRPWAEMSVVDKRKRVVMLAALGIVAVGSILASGFEFKHYLDREKEVGQVSFGLTAGQR